MLALTGCETTTPDKTPTLDGTSPVAGSPVTPGHEQSSQQEQLNIAGTWECTAAYDDKSINPIGYPFIINSNDSPTVNIGLGLSLGLQPASLTIKPDQISWTDTYTNPKGWDVTIKLQDGSIDGASGSFINRSDDSTGTFTDCRHWNAS